MESSEWLLTSSDKFGDDKRNTPAKASGAAGTPVVLGGEVVRVVEVCTGNSSDTSCDRNASHTRSTRSNKSTDISTR